MGGRNVIDHKNKDEENTETNTDASSRRGARSYSGYGPGRGLANFGERGRA